MTRGSRDLRTLDPAGPSTSSPHAADHAHPPVALQATSPRPDGRTVGV